MYIIKNALRCIDRSKGRNVLIGIIALVIAISACLGLSIRQAAESAKSSALDNMNITATISYDRSSAMSGMMGGGGMRPGSFDQETQEEIMAIFRELANQGKCVILVSHSPEVAESCDERYVLTKISGKPKKKKQPEPPSDELPETLR